MSCIIRAGERFGMLTIIDILRGSKNEKIRNSHLDTLTTYGIMESVPKEYIRQTREYVSGQREYMRNIMKMMGYVVFASKANYLFFKGRPGLEKEALEAGFLIRDCQNYEGLSEGFYRIAVRTKEENERLITWLGRL